MVDQTNSSVAMAADYAMPTAVKPDLRTRLQNFIPKLVLAPSLALILVFVYGFIIFSVYLSFTGSRILPSYDWVGLENYEKLFRLRHWSIAIKKPWHFRRLVYRNLYSHRPEPCDFSGPEDPRRRLLASNLPVPDGAQLHRDRYCMEVVPRSGHRA